MNEFTIVYFLIVAILFIIAGIVYIRHNRKIIPQKELKYCFTEKEYDRYNEIAASAINNTTLMFNPDGLNNDEKYENYNNVYRHGAELMKKEGIVIPFLEDRNHG